MPAVLPTCHARLDPCFGSRVILVIQASELIDLHSFLRWSCSCLFCRRLCLALFLIEVRSPFKAVLCLLGQVLGNSVWEHDFQLCGLGSTGRLGCSLSVKMFQVVPSLLDVFNFCSVLLQALLGSHDAWLGLFHTLVGRFEACMAVWFWPARILLLRGTDSSLAAFTWSNSALSDLVAE